jgi:Holliday junction resolvase RusA-like endonuclease
MQTFIIKGRFPDANIYINAERSNRYAAAKIKNKWTEIVKKEIQAQKIKKIDYSITIFFLWVVRDKKRDKDNIMFGQKFVFDGLVKAGIIKNDGWNNVSQIHHNFLIAGKNQKEYLKVDLL